jgi:hypothetical protein
MPALSRFPLLCSLALALCGLATPNSAAAAVPGPAGIFVIGDTRTVPGEIAKFDFDFVAGYTLRAPWTSLETWNEATQSPIYDFSRLDSSLEELRARGKRMTLEVFIDTVPDYILALPGTVTWNNPHPTRGGVRVVPWDANALAAYAALLQAMSNHIVAGTSWRIADHPALQSVDSSIVGLQGLRELSGTLVNHPEYTRQRFVDSVLAAVHLSRAAFPDKYGFLALFLMEDGTPSPSLDDTILARLLAEFNQPGGPTLGFFQETLSDTGPTTSGVGSLLAQASSETYILFQALRPWVLVPSDGGVRPPEIASATPLAGLERAWTQFQAPYVELYGADILNTDNHAGLRRWSSFLRAVDDSRHHRDTPRLEQIAPGEYRLRWTHDALLTRRVLSSPDLATWSPLDLAEPLDGEVTVPGPAEKIFYRLETLMPTR